MVPGGGYGASTRAPTPAVYGRVIAAQPVGLYSAAPAPAFPSSVEEEVAAEDTPLSRKPAAALLVLQIVAAALALWSIQRPLMTFSSVTRSADPPAFSFASDLYVWAVRRCSIDGPLCQDVSSSEWIKDSCNSARSSMCTNAAFDHWNIGYVLCLGIAGALCAALVALKELVSARRFGEVIPFAAGYAAIQPLGFFGAALGLTVNFVLSADSCCVNQVVFDLRLLPVLYAVVVQAVAVPLYFVLRCCCCCKRAAGSSQSERQLASMAPQNGAIGTASPSREEHRETAILAPEGAGSGVPAAASHTSPPSTTGSLSSAKADAQQFSPYPFPQQNIRAASLDSQFYHSPAVSTARDDEVSDHVVELQFE